MPFNGRGGSSPPSRTGTRRPPGRGAFFVPWHFLPGIRLTPVTGPFPACSIGAGRFVRMPTPDSDLPEVVRIARDLIRFDTTNWGGGRAEGEREAAEYVGAYLEALGLQPRVLRADSAPHERHGARPRAQPRQARARAARASRRRAGDGRGLDGRSVRGRDPRRDAVGPRRRRHEGHGRHDPHVGRRHPARRRAARARPDPGVLRRRGERRRRRIPARRHASTRSGSRARPRRSARSAATRSRSATAAPTCCRWGRRR